METPKYIYIYTYMYICITFFFGGTESWGEYNMLESISTEDNVFFTKGNFAFTPKHRNPANDYRSRPASWGTLRKTDMFEFWVYHQIGESIVMFHIDHHANVPCLINVHVNKNQWLITVHTKKKWLILIHPSLTSHLLCFTLDKPKLEKKNKHNYADAGLATVAADRGFWSAWCFESEGLWGAEWWSALFFTCFCLILADIGWFCWWLFFFQDGVVSRCSNIINLGTRWCPASENSPMIPSHYR